MKILLNTAALLLVVSPWAPAQAEPTPTPSPEVQKLGYYVGSWEGHGKTKGGPLGAAGKLSSRQACSWFAGGFQVVCKGEETGPSGKRSFLNILSYDQETNSYSEYSISSFGEAEYDRGGVMSGDTLSFLIDQNVGGKHAAFRYAERHLSPVRYTYRAEVAVDGKPWMEVAEGEIRKLK